MMRTRNFHFALALALGTIAGCTQGTPPVEVRPTTPATAPRPTSQRPPRSANNGDSNDGNLLLGNPTNAGKTPDNYLLAHPQYTMSYNRSRGGANWVAWHIDAQDLGQIDRRDNFRPDPDLPKDWQIGPSDYRGSGYDRGHVCPSADRTRSREDNDATFYMSNMLPQTADLNRAVWADFENELRSIVRQGNEIYVIAGGSGKKETIANGQVTVPQVCWKVALILPTGKNDLKRINAQTRVIAVAMPNVTDKKLKNGDWRDYIVTTKKLSGAIKMDFFPGLPKSLQTALEAKKDSGD